MEEEAGYSHIIFKHIQFLICRRYVFTWTYVIAITLCINQERSLINAVSTKTIYYVSRNEVENHIIASRNCYVLEGHLIDLESSLTEVFLRKFGKVLYPNVDNQTLYYTGLRYANPEFIWIKRRCSFARRLATFIKNFTPDPSIQAFQIRYVGGSSGNLAENFDGFWNTPSGGQHSLICQVRTTQECSFVERRNAVVVDTSLQIKMFVDVDLYTCLRYCSDMEECGIFCHSHYSRDCTLWFADNLDNPSNFIVDTTISNSTVRYKDCVEVQFFDAWDLRQGNTYLPCNFEKETSAVATAATTDRLSTETSTLGSYFSTLRTTIEEVTQTAATTDRLSTETSTLGNYFSTLRTTIEEVTQTPATTDRLSTETSTLGNYFSTLRTTIEEVTQTTATTDRLSTETSTLGNYFTLRTTIKEVTQTASTLPIEGDITTEGSTRFPFNTNYYNTSPWDSEISAASLGYIDTSYTWSTTLCTESTNPISRTGIMYTSASSVKALEVALAKCAACLCASKAGITHSLEQKAEFTRQILAHLYIDINSTSANIRKYICARDDRLSAKSIGSFGAVIIGVVLSVPVLFDLCNFINFLSRVLKKAKGSVTVKPNTICPE